MGPLEEHPEVRELRDYLGDRYDAARLVTHQHQLEQELAAVGDEDRFYRVSEGYLYDLTAFALSGTKEPYLERLRRTVRPPASLLDLGCGIGSDGLRLLAEGYRVTFADFDNPSTRYLRWRLERRGLSAPVLDLDRDRLPGGFDLAYAFDVIEHVDDPVGFLGQMERAARLVLVNLLEDEPQDTALHHRSLPVPLLVDRVSAQGLVGYERLHGGRSHLLLYRPGRPGAAGRLRARAVRLAGGWRHRTAGRSPGR